jgi:hypothetical protein
MYIGLYVYWVVCILGCAERCTERCTEGCVRDQGTPPAADAAPAAADAADAPKWTFGAGSNRSGVQGAHLNPHGPLFEPPGPLLTHLHTVCMACSECLPTGLNPLAERTLFPPGSAGRWTARAGSWARPRARSVGPRGPQRAPPRLDGDTHRAVKERCLGLLW